MARTYTDKDLGSWFKQDGSGEDSKMIQVNIIEFSDGFARTVGQNIPIDEFERDYRRSDDMSSGPWGDLNPAQFGIDLLATNDSIDEIVPSMEQFNKNNISKSSFQTNYMHESEDSYEHQLIRNAIKLSKNTSNVTLDIDYEIPFDVHKIRTIMNTMDIEPQIVIDVLMNHIKNHPELFFISIEQSLTKLFTGNIADHQD